MHKLLDEIKCFKWKTIKQMYGNAHSSVIGFISTEWINSNNKKNRFILDGAYSIESEKNKYTADLILCEGDKPQVVVEVESGISKYSDKIKSLSTYLNKEDTNLKFGILIMLNGWRRKKDDGGYWKHNWSIEEEITENIRDKILLISIKKKEREKNNPIIKETRNRNHYNKENCEVVCRSYISGQQKEYKFYPADLNKE